MCLHVLYFINLFMLLISLWPFKDVLIATLNIFPAVVFENTHTKRTSPLTRLPHVLTTTVLSCVTQNSTRPPLKLSNVERITNFQILVLFGCLLAISLVCSVGQTIWKYQYGNDAWYMDLNCKSPNSPCCTSYSTYFVSLVHISLFLCHFELLS